MTEHTVLDTDNRDQTATVLHLEDGSQVEVDPCELFYNQYSNRFQVTDSGEVTLYGPHPRYWESIIETITESLHQSLDGWSEEEQKTIQKYLADIKMASQITYDGS